MKEYNIVNILPYKNSLSDFGIVLVNPVQIPPHLAIVIKNVYYDIAVSCVRQIDWTQVILQFKNKNTPFIFIKLKESSHKFTTEEVFKEPISLNNQTCLEPIKKIIQSAYRINTEDCNVVFDLLDILRENNLIENYSGYLVEKQLLLKRYARKDVLAYIKNLKINLSDV